MKALKKKTTNTIRQEDSLSKNRGWYNFTDDGLYSIFPNKQDWRKRFIESVLEWAEKETSLEIMQFCMERRIPYQTLLDWRNKFPDVGEAFNLAKLMLASRRRIGALKKDFDKDVVFKDLHRLDPEWLEVDSYHAKLKLSETPQDTTINVAMVDPRKRTPNDGLDDEVKK